MTARVGIWTIIIGLLVTMLTGTASASEPEPYRAWAFDVRRANEKNDLNALTALAAAKPDFARVWFYGQIYDLVNPMVPEGERTVLGQRLAQIAGLLRSQGDPLPALFIDRIATGRLTKDAERSRTLVETWRQGLLGGGGVDPIRLTTVQEPELALGIFYSLIFRAEVTAGTLGRSQKAIYLAISRALAEGFALGAGDLTPWRCLSAYRGGPITMGKVAHIEQVVTQALNAALTGDFARSRTDLLTALRLGTNARGANLYVAFIMNGAANAHAWLKDHIGARSLRVRVLQGVRGLKLPKLTALVARQMVADHLADKQLDDMIPYTREMRELGPVVESNTRSVAILVEAAKALETETQQRVADGRLTEALRVLREAERLYQFVARDALIGLGHMQSEIAGLKDQRRRARAELIRLEGWIAIRRGKYDEARAAFQQVAQLYDSEIGDPLKASTALTSHAHSILASGDSAKALEQTKAVQARLGQSGDAVARATNYLVQGWARLSRGELAKAYGNANYALQVLHDAGVVDAQPKLRARLHALAATVLDGAGMVGAAAERVAYALKFAPADREIVRMGAAARLGAGDVDGAIAALTPLMSTRFSQIASVWKGCLLIQAGRLDEGLATLDVVVPQLTLPHLMHSHIVGRTCITAGYLKKGDAAAARRAIQPARARLLEYPHPALTWRVHTLDGQVSLLEGRHFEAAGAWRQAIDRYLDFLGERAWRGAHIGYRELALPQSPLQSLKALPTLLGKIAQKDSKNAAVHGAAAIKAAQWLDQWSMSPRNRAFDATVPTSDANMNVHGQLTRLDETRKVLEDSAVVHSDRAAASVTFRQNVEALRSAVRGMRATEPVVYDYYAPEPRDALLEPNEAMLRFIVADTESHLWLVIPGFGTRFFKLPGRTELATLVRAAQTAMMTKPAEWDVSKKRPRDPNMAAWKALAKPTRTLLPFVGSKAIMAALSGRQIKVIPDGPLTRLPLDALILKVPSRKNKGEAPTFVGSQLQLHYMMLDQTRPAVENRGTGIAILGALGASAGGCPISEAGNACAAEHANGISGALKTAIGTHQTVVAIDGAALQAEGIQAALRDNRITIVTSPSDLATGTFVTAAPGPGQMLGRLGGESLAGLKGISGDVLLASAVGLPLEMDQGMGLRRLHANLRAAGVRTVVLSEFGSGLDTEAYGNLGQYLASGATLRDAVGSRRMALMTSPYDLENGGPVRHHPYYWAGALVYSDQSTPISVVIPVAPAPVVTEQSASPASAEAPAVDAAPDAPAEAPAADTPDASATPDAPAADTPDAPATSEQDAPATPAAESEAPAADAAPESEAEETSDEAASPEASEAASTEAPEAPAADAAPESEVEEASEEAAAPETPKEAAANITDASNPAAEPAAEEDEGLSDNPFGEEDEGTDSEAAAPATDAPVHGATPEAPAESEEAEGEGEASDTEAEAGEQAPKAADTTEAPEGNGDDEEAGADEDGEAESEE